MVAMEAPPVPARRYLEDACFMTKNFNGQPAVPPRTNTELQRMCSSMAPPTSPRAYLMDETFVKGLNQFVAKLTSEEVPNTEEKIYQPLIPPRYYEEGCEEKDSIYQVIEDKPKGLAHKMVEGSMSKNCEKQVTMSQYQPLENKFSQSRRTNRRDAFENVVLHSHNRDNVNIQSSSTNHYQPLRKKMVQRIVTQSTSLKPSSSEVEENYYQPLMKKRNEKNETRNTLLQTSPPNEIGENCYQALSRGQEDSIYMSLTVQR